MNNNLNNNNNNIQQVCSICESQPQDMLILSCHHNLCLDCATEVYNLNSSKSDKIVCEMCLSDTQLDEDTIVCLRSLSAKRIQQSRRQQKNGQNIGLVNSNSNNKYQHSNKQVTYPPKSNNNNKTKQDNHIKQQLPFIVQNDQHHIQSSLLFCQRHQQRLTYYCMDCNNFRICSECMLADNHRLHKVITLKKATIQVKEMIEKVIREKERLKAMLQKDRQSLITRKQQSQKQLQQNIMQIKSTFEQIHKLIQQKQQQLQKIIQQQGNRKLQIMQGAVDEIQQKIMLIQQTIQFQQQLIQCVGGGVQNNCNRNNINININKNNKNDSISSNSVRMFEYYERQIAQVRVNFQPSLPNFISEILEIQIYQKQQIFIQLEQLLQGLDVVTPSVNKNDIDQDEYSQNNDEINYISQIDTNQQRQVERQQRFKQRLNLKGQKVSTRQKSNNNNNQIYSKNHISENINIIQLTNNNNNSIKLKQYNNNNKPTQTIINKPKQNSKPPQTTPQSKLSKQTVQAIKKKARQNLNDRQLSQSRKMDLSRSIENATDILNKIQQRSSRL